MNYINRNFLFILILKLFLLFLFSSEYNKELFYPFLITFSLENLNPWQHFYEINELDVFPYHGLMLFILVPFSYLGELINQTSLIKIPLLIADLGIYIILIKMYPHKEKRIFIFYFSNPIILYAIYIHSQLDIIPTVLFFSSVFFINRKKLKTSALFLGFALATKFHVVVALPLVIFYLYRNYDLKSLAIYLLILSFVFTFFDAPFILNDAFIEMVIFNPKQSLLFDTFYNIGSVKILLPVAAIFMVYLHFFNQNNVNEDLLFFYFGFLFAATIFFIYPGPAWYVWIIPFMSIYFIRNENQKKTFFLHSGFSILYLVFFLFFYKSEYQDIFFLNNVINLKIDNENLENLSFTLLESSLLAIMYSFYKYGIKSNSIYKKQTSLVIGIGGDSGVGKSTLVRNFKNILGEKLINLEGDGEHKWERGDQNWANFTHLDPKANHIHKQAELILKLKNNQHIYRNEYDHQTGQFTESLKIIPKEFIIIAGLHPFYLPKLRKNIDLKIYIDTDETLRRHWKIIRDTKKRGYSIEKITEQIENRSEDAKKYIHPQREFADLIIKFFSTKEFKLGSESEKIKLGLEITLDANIHIEDILEKLYVEFDWNYNEDLQSQYVLLKEAPEVDFEAIAINTIENINEIIQPEIIWNNGYDGFIELIFLKMISEKLKEDRK
jgi:uridine kinase